MLLDYGSGRKYPMNYKTSDFTGSPKYDFMIQDYKIEEINDGDVNALRCRNVLHHIKPKDMDELINEFLRLLGDDGVLIVSEPKEEFFVENRTLDLIWYRFLTEDYNIYIPNKYYNYRTHFEKHFQLIIESYDGIKNEVLLFKKRNL